MSLRNASDVVDSALRTIGSLSVYDTGSDPESYAVGLEWLDMMLDEVVGTKRIWFFVPATAEVALEAGVSSYNIANLLDDNRLQFIRSASLLRSGKQTELNLIRRRSFDYVSNDLPTGTPSEVYVERNDNPVLTIFPAPIEGDILLLNGQKYSKDILSDKGRVAHGFPASWQRWMVLSLAADIGDGPVLTLPDSKLNRLMGKAQQARAKLDSYSNTENIKQPRFVRMREF